MARKIKTRSQKSTIPTLIGAGLTEHWYFKHLKEILGCKIKIRPRFFGKEDIFQLSNKIDDAIKDDGIAIVVFDADVATWDEKEKIKLKTLKSKYGNKSNVVLCDSLPSIEYWFLLHFADIHRLFQNSDSVTKELLKHLPNYKKTAKFLSNPNWVEIMCADDKLNVAMQRASKSERGQSYTNIPKAINKILSKTDTKSS